MVLFYTTMRSIFQKLPQHSAGVVLLLQVPRANEKKELAAEQFFASLHGLLINSYASARHARERISLEIAVKQKRIGFYVWVPEELESFVEEQIYAQYPTVQITKIDDYALPQGGDSSLLTAELKMTKSDVLPIKTFPSFEVDPLAAITATLAKFENHEEAWIQVLVQPARDNWYKKTERFIADLQGGKKTSTTGVLGALWAAPEAKETSTSLNEYQRAQVSGAELKSQKLAYETSVRIIYQGNISPGQARMRMQAIIASFKQFNTTYLNGFTDRYISPDPQFLTWYQTRQFKGRGFNCNIEELASLYHLPHTSVETPNILWASSTTAEPPATLPLVEGDYQHTLSPIAATNFRGHNTMFGLKRVDRSRHLYIIGQTGTGKSGMLELLTISDIYSPYGFAVIDPHGDYALNIMRRIPAARAKDVIYFNPADTDFPIAFNPMEVNDPKLKTHTVSELIGVLKRMFESWGPRLEYILRYTLLALLDYPNATMLDITRMLTDKKFRAEVVSYVEDPVVANFWNVEFASWNEKFMTEAVAPVLNKVGAFTANPLVRNIIGQPKSSFNIRQIMDERKILIVNLSRGLIGEDNAALLGALLVTKIQLGAMSRADIAAEDRVPFYLYVDEFQNFATDSFATILSEARKYALNLTVANQYIAQMMDTVKDAVFGNVGSIITFRTSADDARSMLRYVEPRFTESDMVHMHNRHFVISMTIDGEKVPAFSAFSLNLPTQMEDHSDEIIRQSRESYAINKGHVEDFMHERYLSKAALPQQGQQNQQRGGQQRSQNRPQAQSQPQSPAAPAHEPVSSHPAVASIVTTEPLPTKAKRKRRRKKKTEGTAAPAEKQPTEAAKHRSHDDETVIHLR
jgi:hypothetical protein